MEKVRLLKPHLNKKPGDILILSTIRAGWAIRTGKAELVEDTKPEQAPKNKAEKRPKKNK